MFNLILNIFKVLKDEIDKNEYKNKHVLNLPLYLLNEKNNLISQTKKLFKK